MKVNSKFKIFMQSDLSSLDFKVLALLYQPLIGMDGFSLYNTLYQLNNTNKLTKHQFLLDILNVKQSSFISTREKLEALSLLESYQRSEDEYLYILKSPFTAKQFLVETFLGTYLESEIGSTNFKQLIEIFKVEKPVTVHLDNITKDFQELYSFKATKLFNIEDDFLGKNGFDNKLIRKSIDYEEFIEKLPRAFKSASLFNNNYKQQIIQIAFVYQFDIDQMIEIYSNAHRGSSTVTIEQLGLQAKKLYESLNKDISISNVEVSEDDALSNISYVAIVEKFGNENITQRSSALNTINSFINQNDIDLGVLNVLLIFIFKNKDGILPHVNYLNKVWESWAKNGVQSVTDAINYRNTLEQNWSNRQSAGSYSNKKTVKKPDWLDEYMDEISKMEG